MLARSWWGPAGGSYGGPAVRPFPGPLRTGKRDCAGVAVLISLFAPATQAGWNPARDLGPRLVALALGWGPVAIPGPEGGCWVYLVGPIVGGPVGGFLARLTGLDDRPASGERDRAMEDLLRTGRPSG